MKATSAIFTAGVDVCNPCSAKASAVNAAAAVVYMFITKKQRTTTKIIAARLASVHSWSELAACCSQQACTYQTTRLYSIQITAAANLFNGIKTNSKLRRAMKLYVGIDVFIHLDPTELGNNTYQI